MTWPEWLDHVGQFTVAKIVGWVVGITAALIALRKVWPWIKSFVRMVDTIADLPDRLDKIEKWQEVTAKELTDNHGSTLKDAVERTETTMAVLRDDLAVHIEYGSTLKDAVERTETTMAVLRDDLAVHIEFCKQRERLLSKGE
ncbi:MAG: hypothetical protein IPQ22_16990 [Rhodoferax sp.]|nr:hypothetical protein [Rhodoferax sp.]